MPYPAAYLATSLSEKQLAEMHRLMTEEVREVAIFFMDIEGVVTSWNRGAEEMKGYTGDEAIGKHLRMLYTDEDRARGWPEHNLRKAKEDGFYREETWRKKKDGSVFWARIALTALFDRQGVHLGYSKITLDLTSHKLLESCVAERNETRRVLKAANAGMWSWHPVDNRMDVCSNFLDLLGFPEMEGTMNFDAWLDFLEPNDRPLFAERLQKAHEQSPASHFAAEIRMCPKDRKCRWFYVHADWYRESEHSPRMLSGVIVDIDELKTTTELLLSAVDKLKQADVRKDEFLAMLAHELRNPLAPISAAAQVLRIGRYDEARVKRTSEVIARQVDHMARLISDLLDVSRVTRGLVELERGRVEFRRVIDDAVEQVNPIVIARGHRLELDLSPTPAFVDGDEKRMVQMVSNLLQNAAKFTPEGGHIVVSTHVRDGQVIVRVADDGIGMSDDLIKHVFELFVQAKRTPDRSAGGLGLGLALVKSLAELHGGSVDCRSPGPGQGSVFSISLPAISENESSDSHDSRDASDPAEVLATDQRNQLTGLQPASRQLQVLVVDDNVDAAQMLGSYLEEMGYGVVIENGALPALDRARRLRPEVCLFDIGLPGMDGLELARRIRAQPETSDCVLIAITGYGSEDDSKAIIDAGFSHHFVKPVDGVALVALLGALQRRD